MLKVTKSLLRTNLSFFLDQPEQVKTEINYFAQKSTYHRTRVRVIYAWTGKTISYRTICTRRRYVKDDQKSILNKTIVLPIPTRESTLLIKAPEHKNANISRRKQVRCSAQESHNRDRDMFKLTKSPPRIPSKTIWFQLSKKEWTTKPVFAANPTVVIAMIKK